jgi:lipoprotein-anchoring transpeptidase ErfK/SrfK
VASVDEEALTVGAHDEGGVALADVEEADGGPAGDDGEGVGHLVDDVVVVLAPRAFPKVAERGEKWVEVSLSQQTLTLWEGTRPVYATLVSTGRENYATPIGEFRISNKHITATMDSDEGSDVAGGAPKARSASSETAPPKPASGGAKPGPKSAKPSKPPKPGDKKGAKPASGKTSPSKPADKSASKPAEKIPTKGDGEYGVTRRRGEGTYKLRDVPYIQYFAAGVALHAAYWHDVFGKERSHGCVNLSPIDAHRVFMWTEPAIPDGWHGLNSGDGFGEGTTVIVHE